MKELKNVHGTFKIGAMGMEYLVVDIDFCRMIDVFILACFYGIMSDRDMYHLIF